MNTFSLDAADLLVAAGVGAKAGTADWAIFQNILPKDPDNCICITDVPSLKSIWALPLGSTEIQRPTVEIRVRGFVYETVYTKIESIVAALAHKGRFTQGGTSYSDIYQQTPIHSQGQDENNRSRLAVSFTAIRS